MKKSVLLLISLMTTNIYAQSVCDIRSSSTGLDKYEIKRLARSSAITVCIDSDIFDKFDIKEIKQAGARIINR